jgi:hypothetical protein
MDYTTADENINYCSAGKTLLEMHFCAGIGLRSKISIEIGSENTTAWEQLTVPRYWLSSNGY